MDSLMQDLRYAWRTLAKAPAMSIVAVATLALGMGANSAIFSVVNAVIVRPLAFPHADRLVRVSADFTGLGAADIGLSPPELQDYRDASGLFEEIAGVWAIDANLTQIDEPERVEVLLTSPSYFDVLGVRPQLGRLFSPADNAPGISEVVVISDRLWRQRFGASRDAIGRKLRIDDDTYTVVGVLPPGFRHPGRSVLTDVDLWAPAGFSADPFPSPAPRRGYFLTGAIARLEPGVSVEQAQQQLAAFGARLRQQYPDDYPARAGWEPRLTGLQDSLVGPIKPALLVAFGAVGLVLLIACANIASLLIARATARQREFAVRRALGASRGRIARLLLTESLLLAVLGGAAAAALSAWLLAGLLAIVPAGLPRLNEVAIDGRVLLFNAGVVLLTAVLFGLAPALQGSSDRVSDALKAFGRGSSDARGTLRSAVVVIEVALALVLLVGGALLVRSFWQLAHVDPGFDPANVITARLWLPQPNDPSKGRYFNPARRVALYDEILRRARTLPGVSGAAAAGWLPLDGTRATSTITADGQETGGASAVPAVQATFASSGYFEVMGIRLLRGRSFTEQDDARAAPVVVITESMARQFWPGQDPIGRRVHFGGPQASNPWMTVIGVVRDVRAQRLEEAPRPALYRPLAQASNLAVSIVVKTSVDAATLGPALAREVRAADPDLPTYGVRTMAEIVAAATASRRFATQLVGGFGVVALLLAAVGVYGVMSFIVGQRAREMAIRIALGARPGRVVAAVLRQALALAAIGIGIGAVAAVQLTRLLRGLLFDVQPNDPLSFGGIAVLLAVAAVAAAWRPAAAAAGVDPMTALRME